MWFSRLKRRISHSEPRTLLRRVFCELHCAKASSDYDYPDWLHFLSPVACLARSTNLGVPIGFSIPAMANRVCGQRLAAGILSLRSDLTSADRKAKVVPKCGRVPAAVSLLPRRIDEEPSVFCRGFMRHRLDAIVKFSVGASHDRASHGREAKLRYTTRSVAASGTER